MNSTEKASEELPLGVVVLSKNQNEAFLLLRYLDDNAILVHAYHWGCVNSSEKELIRQLRVTDYGFFFNSSNFLLNYDKNKPGTLLPFHPVTYNHPLVRGVLVDILRPGTALLDTNYKSVTVKNVNWSNNVLLVNCIQKTWKRFLGEYIQFQLPLDQVMLSVPLLITKKMCDQIIRRFTGKL